MTIENSINEALYTDRKPCFICENEADAAAIRAAVSRAAVNLAERKPKALPMKARAITISDSDLIAAITDRRPVCVLIIAYDNSQAGKNHAEELDAKLKRINSGSGASSAQLPPVKYITAEYKSIPAGLHLNEIDTGNTAHLETLAEDVTANYLKAWDITRQEINEHSASNYLLDILNAPAIKPQPTGFIELDKALDGGLLPGSLYVLAAISSLGKTTLALQISDSVAAAGQSVLFFALEMGARELVARSVSRYTYMLDKQNAATARTITGAGRQLNFDQYEIINKAQLQYWNDINDNLYFYESTFDIGTEDIRSALKAHIEISGKKPALIIVDYLQIMRPANLYLSDKMNVDRSITELKKLARDYDISVLVISSLNRGSYRTDTDLDALKESGGVEYSSDVVLALQVPKLDAGKTPKAEKENKEKIENEKKKPVRELELKVLKNRHGATGQRIQFTYNAMFNHFTDQISEKPAHGSGIYNPFE